MAKFLTTTGVSYELEELIRGAEERLVLISPFLRVNQRIRDLLADKDRLKIDTRVVYGKSELSPEQSEWLSSTPSIRTSYCSNLHAKCYLSEEEGAPDLHEPLRVLPSQQHRDGCSRGPRRGRRAV